MIPEERQPFLDGIWVSRGSPDPPRDTPFREIETQLEQFAVNARRSPGRILGNHSKDQGANLFADTLPPSYLYKASGCRRRAKFSRTRSSRERKELTIHPRRSRSDTIMTRILSEPSEFSFTLSHSFCRCTTFWRNSACRMRNASRPLT